MNHNRYDLPFTLLLRLCVFFLPSLGRSIQPMQIPPHGDISPFRLTILDPFGILSLAFLWRVIFDQRGQRWIANDRFRVESVGRGGSVACRGGADDSGQRFGVGGRGSEEEGKKKRYQALMAQGLTSVWCPAGIAGVGGCQARKVSREEEG